MCLYFDMEDSFYELQDLIHGVATFDFLLDFFEKELPEELSVVCGVRKETARRWICGRPPAWQHYSRSNALFRFFFALRHGLGMSNKEALCFYRNARHMSRSPSECIKGGFPAFQELDAWIDVLLEQNNGLLFGEEVGNQSRKR